jgi:hypothetical protein
MVSYFGQIVIEVDKCLDNIDHYYYIKGNNLCSFNIGNNSKIEIKTLYQNNDCLQLIAECVSGMYITSNFNCYDIDLRARDISDPLYWNPVMSQKKFSEKIITIASCLHFKDSLHYQS